MFNLQVEGQRAAQAQAQQENAVLSKVEKIRIDQSRRADALEAEAKIEENKVSYIDNNRRATGLKTVRIAMITSKASQKLSISSHACFKLESRDGFHPRPFVSLCFLDKLLWQISI